MAKLFVFEDSGDWFGRAKDGTPDGMLVRSLRRDGHEVDTLATNMEEAGLVIDALRERVSLNGRPAEPYVALVDGNLQSGVHTGEDGAHITARLRALGVFRLIIGFSGDPKGVTGVDVNLGKSNAHQLNEVIAAQLAFPAAE